MWIALMILKGDMTSIPRGQLGRDTSCLWILLWVGKICVRKFNYFYSYVPGRRSCNRDNRGFLPGTRFTYSKSTHRLSTFSFILNYSSMSDVFVLFLVFVSVLRFIWFLILFREYIKIDTVSERVKLFFVCLFFLCGDMKQAFKSETLLISY